MNSENSWIAADDGVQLHRTHWQATEPRRSTIVLIHGHGEHSGRYDHVGSYMASKGHEVFGFDLRGHGRSGGRTAYVDRFERYIADARTILADVRRTRPNAPLFILGHSMGGLVALRLALTHPDEMDGVLASGPFITASVSIPRPLLFFGNLISRFLPTMPTLDISGRPLTHDAEMAAQRDADPLSYRGRVLARTGNEMRLAGNDLRARARELRIPLYLFHGTQDYLADWRGSLAVFARARSDDKTLTLYRDLYHETLNETNRDAVMRAIADWLDERLHSMQSDRDDRSD